MKTMKDFVPKIVCVSSQRLPYLTIYIYPSSLIFSDIFHHLKHFSFFVLAEVIRNDLSSFIGPSGHYDLVFL